MSIEYRAALLVDEETIAALRTALSEDSRYAILETTDGRRMALRYRTLHGEGSPEDVDIVFDDGLYIAFHTGARKDRQELLGAIRKVLSTRGYECEFEEQ